MGREREGTGQRIRSMSWFVGSRQRRQRHLPVATNPKDLSEALCQWACSMPWVSEERELGGVVFLLDCPDVRCSGPWFIVEAADDGMAGPDVLLVILPTHLAHRGASAGWVVDLGDLEGDRSLTAAAAPRSVKELAALQNLLLVAYSLAFEYASQTRGPHHAS
jgi:hypothetical protein